MNITSYVNLMKKRLSAQYDLYENHMLLDLSIDLYGHYYNRSEKYFATKSATIYAYECNEHTFIKTFESVSVETIISFSEKIKEQIPEYICLNQDHMSTRFNGILVTKNPIDDNTETFVKRFHFQKSFLFGLKGWADLCLIVVNPGSEKVIGSKKSKKLLPYFRPHPL